MSKYPKTYHLPWSEGTTSNDKISKDILSLLNIDVVITEKLDGENTAITRGGVYSRSHVSYTISPWSKEVRKIHNIIRNDISEDMYIFGENMEGIHSIEYSDLKSYFYIFGIRDNNIWLPWDQVEEYAYLLNLPVVPVLFRGIISNEKELKDIVLDLVKQKSILGGEREGIVIRNADMFHNDDFSLNVQKWVRKGHIQTDEHWTKNWAKAKLNI